MLYFEKVIFTKTTSSKITTIKHRSHTDNVKQNQRNWAFLGNLVAILSIWTYSIFTLSTTSSQKFHQFLRMEHWFLLNFHRIFVKNSNIYSSKKQNLSLHMYNTFLASERWQYIVSLTVRRKWSNSTNAISVIAEDLKISTTDFLKFAVCTLCPLCKSRK